MRLRQLTGLLLFSLAALAASCVKEVKDVRDIPEKSPIAVESVPYYQKGSLAFDTKESINREKDAAAEAIKRRIEGAGKIDFKIFDPWLPPTDVKSEKLAAALQFLPKDYYGYPDWTSAVQKGIIRPQASLPGKAETATAGQEETFDEDIVFEINDRLMYNVRFPHKVHNFWLSCKVCHPAIFKPKKGANVFSMYDIWDGKFCGRCHGKVAFQPKGYNNCRRCHSSKKKTMGIR
ncbi:MAG: hypothetical protein HZB22_01235 [Deltaproteobacteria bacterium]|nr:hypothetical protein [Deltaproteobacteria bacterium]